MIIHTMIGITRYYHHRCDPIHHDLHHNIPFAITIITITMILITIFLISMTIITCPGPWWPPST